MRALEFIRSISVTIYLRILKRAFDRSGRNEHVGITVCFRRLSAQQWICFMSQVSICSELTTFAVHCEVYFNLLIFYDRIDALLLSATNAFCASQVRNIGVFWNRAP
jgi:hypothetical protein